PRKILKIHRVFLRFFSGRARDCTPPTHRNQSTWFAPGPDERGSVLQAMQRGSARAGRSSSIAERRRVAVERPAERSAARPAVQTAFAACALEVMARAARATRGTTRAGL